MAKIEWNTNRKLTGAGIGMSGIIIGNLIKVESLLSLFFMIEDPTVMIIARIIVSVAIGGVLWGAYWLYLKITDWTKFKLGRIKLLEDRIKELNNQEEKHLNIENNHLIQTKINVTIAEALDKLGESELEEFLKLHKGAEKFYKCIKRGDPSISDEDANRIVSAYEMKDKLFQKPHSTKNNIEKKKEDWIDLSDEKTKEQ